MSEIAEGALDIAMVEGLESGTTDGDLMVWDATTGTYNSVTASGDWTINELGVNELTDPQLVDAPAADAVMYYDTADDTLKELAGITGFTLTDGVLAMNDDFLTKAKFADENWGDVSVSGNSVTLNANTVGNAEMSDDAIDSDEIADGAIDAVHMSANSVDSDAYVDGSIDPEHLAATVRTECEADPDEIPVAEDEFIAVNIPGTYSNRMRKLYRFVPADTSVEAELTLAGIGEENDPTSVGVRTNAGVFEAYNGASLMWGAENVANVTAAPWLIEYTLSPGTYRVRVRPEAGGDWTVIAAAYARPARLSTQPITQELFRSRNGSFSITSETTRIKLLK